MLRHSLRYGMAAGLVAAFGLPVSLFAQDCAEKGNQHTRGADVELSYAARRESWLQPPRSVVDPGALRPAGQQPLAGFVQRSCSGDETVELSGPDGSDPPMPSIARAERVAGHQALEITEGGRGLAEGNSGQMDPVRTCTNVVLIQYCRRQAAKPSPVAQHQCLVEFDVQPMVRTGR